MFKDVHAVRTKWLIGSNIYATISNCSMTAPERVHAWITDALGHRVVPPTPGNSQGHLKDNFSGTVVFFRSLDYIVYASRGRNCCLSIRIVQMRQVQRRTHDQLQSKRIWDTFFCCWQLIFQDGIRLDQWFHLFAHNKSYLFVHHWELWTATLNIIPSHFHTLYNLLVSRLSVLYAFQGIDLVKLTWNALVSSRLVYECRRINAICIYDKK